MAFLFPPQLPQRNAGIIRRIESYLRRYDFVEGDENCGVDEEDKLELSEEGKGSLEEEKRLRQKGEKRQNRQILAFRHQVEHQVIDAEIVTNVFPAE